MSKGKYQNKYRIASIRAQWWDYGWNGAYFITICTKNREHFFGEIKNKKMILSPLGAIADVLWHGIPHHSKFAELGDFVVMPNHIHGILIIDKPRNWDNESIENDGIVGGDGTVDTGHAVADPGHAVDPGRALDLPSQPQQSPTNHPQPSSKPKLTPGQKRFQNIGKGTVSSIIGSYKSAVTNHANRLGLPHQWQTLFHDHIIRNDQEYQRISNYIVNNPDNWGNDKFNH